MRLRAIVVALRLLLSGCASQEWVHISGTSSGPGITTTDEGREYQLNTPPDTSGPTDVIIAFHGYGLAPGTLRATTDLDRAAAIVVYPYGVGDGSVFAD